MSTAELLREIDAFVRQHRMSDTAFGKEALNDGKFVSNLRDGRRVWPETAEKVRGFMRNYRRANPGRRQQLSAIGERS